MKVCRIPSDWRLGWAKLLLIAVFAAPAHAAQEANPSAWLAETRAQIAAKQLDAALQTVNRRLAEAPGDMEARGWRGRLLAWLGRWSQAETDYRAVLQQHPQDVDILVGLADVLAWQQQFAEALAALDRARQADATRADVHVRRGRALRSLERRKEARAAFERALVLDPDDPSAQAGLDSVREEPRHELRVGADYDVFNYTAEAQSYSLNLRSQWTERWMTSAGGSFYERFGGQAGRFAGSVTYTAGRAGAFTVGGAAARDDGIIAKGEAFFEYGRGFRLSATGPVRGVEAFYSQRWLWFESARVLTLGPGAIFYLPRDWTWSLQVTAARSRFPGTAAEWSPSGITRLRFPVRRNVTGNVFFAVGTENFAQADEVGRFSARTWGGGLRWRFAPRQEAGFSVLYQDRSQGRTQASFGFTYAVSF